MWVHIYHVCNIFVMWIYIYNMGLYLLFYYIYYVGLYLLFYYIYSVVYIYANLAVYEGNAIVEFLRIASVDHIFIVHDIDAQYCNYTLSSGFQSYLTLPDLM